MKQYVDLGLPSGIKWATCNVGATKPEEYDDYFAWNECGMAYAANWDSKWRIPNNEEWQELRENCTWTWTRDYNGTGVAGQIVTSKINDNSIFLPAAGHRSYDVGVWDVDSFGNYWSATSKGLDFAWGLCFSLREIGMYYYYRDGRRSTRLIYVDPD